MSSGKVMIVHSIAGMIKRFNYIKWAASQNQIVIAETK